MVLLINGVPIDEAPRDMHQFFLQYPHFKESAANLCSPKPQVVGPLGLLYVFKREFAVTYPHDNKVSLIGTDEVTTDLVIVVRHTGSGATAVSQFDQVFDDDLALLIQRVQAVSYHYDGRLELSVVGGYTDNKSISHSLTTSTLQTLHKQRVDLDLVRCCVGELCTINRNGIPWPMVYGVGVDIKTGHLFPATFTDKGPDMDIRNARTLSRGKNVGLLEVYDCTREELRIGPFSYDPMRAVDLFLQQTDEFLINSFSSVSEVAPPNFILNTRAALKRIKDDPYPSVTVFHNNMPRYYKKDDVTGQWISRYTKEVEALHAPPPVTTTAPLTQVPPPHMTMSTMTMVTPPPPPPPVVAPPPVAPQGVMAPWPPIAQPPPGHPPPHSAVSYY